MKKQNPLSLMLLSILLMAGYVSIASAHNAPFPSWYDPAHAVVDTIAEPDTLDPAWCYDTASGEIISNVYETVTFFDKVYTDGPYNAGKTETFKPQLATDVAVEPSLVTPYAKTFYFKIRGADQYASHTFRAFDQAVDLFKDGEIYSGLLLVRDPEYGMVGKEIGHITPPASSPLVDGFVDRANVPGRQSNGGTPNIIDTTWNDTTQNEWVVLRSIIDANGNGVLDMGDGFDVVRKSRVTSGVLWNVREYWSVTAVVSTSPYTVTAAPVRVSFVGGGSPLATLLTPQDVEYSWERWMVQDREGGPQWMFYYPVLDKYGAVNPAIDPNFGDKIDHAIGSNATHAWIRLVNDFNETRFLQILSQPWSSIVDKAWCVSAGDFDGDWTHGWQYIWDHWHNPAVSFIEGKMRGTGPYVLDYWAHFDAWSAIKNDNYWDGWPAYNTPTGTQRLPNGGFVSRVTWILVPSWSMRRSRFLAGDSDMTHVPRQYRDQILGQVVGGEPVRCFYPFQMLALETLFFNFNISIQSPWLGPGFDPNNPYVIAEDRIPINLFSDVHMRRGFAAAFDYDGYIANAYLGEAERPSDPIVNGTLYDNPMQQHHETDLIVAEQELMAAWGGLVWANGMTFTLVFVYGSNTQEIAMTMLANAINSMNARFHLNLQGVSMATYLQQMMDGMLPLFIASWSTDYPDPDALAFPFMHSQGYFPKLQHYSNPSVDLRIEDGALRINDIYPYNGELDYPDPTPYFNNDMGYPPDTRWPRRSTYYLLQWMYYVDVPSVPLAQPVGRHWEIAWMRGWYYNPLYGGSRALAIDSTAPTCPTLYFYHLWKARTHFGDTNNDGLVNVLDSGTLSGSWTKPSPTSTLGPLGYRIQADINGGTGGTTGSDSGMVKGIWDGKVNILDATLVSAYWDGPPPGPSHP